MSKNSRKGMLRRSKSKSRAIDYIQSKNRITRAEEKKINETLEKQEGAEINIRRVLGDSDPSESLKSTLNTEVDNLVKHYEEKFLKNPRFSYLTINIRDPPDKSTLMKIYLTVCEMGGFKEVTANSAWDEVVKKLEWGSNDSIFEIYKKYLFHYEKAFNKDTQFCLNPKEDSVTFEDLDPNFLIPVKVYNITKPSDITQELLNEALKQDVCIFRNFEKATKLRKELFDPEKFMKKYPNDTIDVVTQDPEVKTFKRTKHEKKKIPISEYVKYQEAENTKDNEGMIKFGVNLDIDKWSEQIDELVGKLPEELMCCSPKDSLQYVRQLIHGVTQPQIYLKVKGSWTGGHEENLRFRAVNINHGPSSSEWNCVGSSNCSLLREAVRDVYDVDIYKNEGLWFADVDFCLGRKIPIICFNQREGDLVLLGPGLEHWVRAFGKATQTAWNFGTIDKLQFEEAIKRMNTNYFIKFKSIVPMWTLMLDIANHEISKLDSDFCRLIYKEIKKKYESDKLDLSEFLEKYSNENNSSDLFIVEPNDSNVLHCTQ